MKKKQEKNKKKSSETKLSKKIKLEKVIKKTGKNQIKQQKKPVKKSNKSLDTALLNVSKKKIKTKSRTSVKNKIKTKIEKEKIVKKEIESITAKFKKSLKANKPITTSKTVPITKSSEDGDFQVYSPEELKEFESIILDKLNFTRNELKETKGALSRRTESGTDDTAVSSKMLEDGAETTARETLNLEAARMQKFISDMEAALVRIKNGTYGRCIFTGKLIPKERLRAVPHTTSTVEGKKLQQGKQQPQIEELEFPPADFVPEFNVD